MRTILMLTVAAIPLLAQDHPAKTTFVYKQLNGGTYEFVSGVSISGPTVKGAPFSAEAVTETTQTLSDGNRIVQRTSSKQYRDSEGRERREETSSMGAIFISDPVAQVDYTLHPETRTAEKGPVPLPGGFFYVNNNRVLKSSDPQALFDVAQRLGGRGAAPGPDVKEEQLGPIQMEGVVAQGTRTTTTIPAGQIGNDRPINVVSERWYSPDLQMTVMTKVSDPRSGDTVYKLTNIVRVDQLRSLFEIPSDYTVGADIPFHVRIPNPQLLFPSPQQ